MTKDAAVNAMILAAVLIVLIFYSANSGAIFFDEMFFIALVRFLIAFVAAFALIATESYVRAGWGNTPRVKFTRKVLATCFILVVMHILLTALAS